MKLQTFCNVNKQFDIWGYKKSSATPILRRVNSMDSCTHDTSAGMFVLQFIPRPKECTYVVSPSTDVCLMSYTLHLALIHHKLIRRASSRQ